MYQECLLEFYGSECEKIENNFLISVKHYSSEGIHDLRVEVKRLKAFFNLIEGINPDFKSKKNFRNVRKLFKTWGSVRDLQVQQFLIRDWKNKLDGDVSEYYNFLKQQEMNAQKLFFLSGKKFDIQDLRKKGKKIERALKNIPLDDAQSKALERVDGLRGQLIELGNTPKLKEEKLHQIRILLKEIRYTLEILQKCFPDLGPQDEQIGKLRDLHQILGKWHDDEMALQFLEGFKSDYKGQRFFSARSYEEFLKYIQKEKVALLAEFENHWRGFILFLNDWSNHLALQNS